MRSDAEVVRAIEDNGAEFLLALGRAGGGEERRDPVHWTVGGSPIAYHNCVVRAALTPAEADAAIEQFVGRLEMLAVPGCWHVGPSMRPGDLVQRLGAHGFTDLDAVEPGMAVDLTALPEAPRVDGLQVERVRSSEALEGFRSVLAAGFGEGEPEADWVCAMYERIGLGDGTAWRHYLGQVEGRPVSTVSVFLGAGVAGLYFVCTLPDERRRGIGAATTLASLHAARAEGYDLAVLTSSPMGQGVYERLGFRVYCEIAVPEYRPGTPGG